MIKLNLGCGSFKDPDFINVDIQEVCRPDLLINLEDAHFPYPDESVDEVRAVHILEHIHNFLPLMKELHRVMKHGAVLNVIVPHPRHDHFIDDPTHVTPITPSTMTCFSKKKCVEWERDNIANTPLAFYLDVDFEIQSVEPKLSPRWQKLIDEAPLARQSQARSEVLRAIEQFNNVIEQTTIVMRKV